jgi:transcriptional regulator with GAF, ATPase, and Fis domain
LAIICSALVENLLESELFGRKRGIYSAVFTKKAGFVIAEMDCLP